MYLFRRLSQLLFGGLLLSSAGLLWADSGATKIASTACNGALSTVQQRVKPEHDHKYQSHAALAQLLKKFPELSPYKKSMETLLLLEGAVAREAQGIFFRSLPKKLQGRAAKLFYFHEEQLRVIQSSEGTLFDVAKNSYQELRPEQQREFNEHSVMLYQKLVKGEDIEGDLDVSLYASQPFVYRELLEKHGVLDRYQNKLNEFALAYLESTPAYENPLPKLRDFIVPEDQFQRVRLAASLSGKNPKLFVAIMHAIEQAGPGQRVSLLDQIPNPNVLIGGIGIIEKIQVGNKFIARKYQQSSEQDVLLEREIETLKALQGDDHFPKFLGRVENEGSVFFDAEWIEGKTLHDNFEIPLRPSDEVFMGEIGRVLTSIKGTLEGLQIMHEKGYLHMDIKADNIMLHKGRVVLIDFGSASKKRAEYEGLFEPPQTAVDGYSSPEQVMAHALKDSNRDLGPKSDVYSVGHTLREILRMNFLHQELSPRQREVVSQIQGLIVEPMKDHSVQRRFSTEEAIESIKFFLEN